MDVYMYMCYMYVHYLFNATRRQEGDTTPKTPVSPSSVGRTKSSKGRPSSGRIVIVIIFIMVITIFTIIIVDISSSSSSSSSSNSSSSSSSGGSSMFSSFVNNV